MVYQINYEAYACNFSLPAAVVGEGMAELEGDYLKVVLLILSGRSNWTRTIDSSGSSRKRSVLTLWRCSVVWAVA